jgi:hypothetical protein
VIATKINVGAIVKDHCATLVHEHNGKPSLVDYFLFYGVPIIAAVLLVFFKGVFGKTVGGILITSFSVFAALLFNLLLLVYDLVKKPEASNLKRRYLRQIYSNISYSILAAIGLIVLLLLYFVALSFPYMKPRIVIAFLVYVLAANFILTILMVLKRVHVLFSEEFKPPPTH